MTQKAPHRTSPNTTRSTSHLRDQAPPIDPNLTLPNDPVTARQEINEVLQHVKDRTGKHYGRANNWDILASWLRVTVTLTAGISALSIFAESQIIAAVFSAITALVAALNTGFNPPEKAKVHRDTAYAYGNLKWPLTDLSHVLSLPVKHVPSKPTDPKARSVADSAFYHPTQDTISLERFSAVWASFLNLRERADYIDSHAPVMRLGRKY